MNSENSKKKEQIVYVMGHQNPDSDSICSAIAMADLRNRECARNREIEDNLSGMLGGLAVKARYVPCRAGHLNQETKYVLKTFGVEPPMFMNDVRTQIKDIDYSKPEPIAPRVSLMQAWKTMRQRKKSTLAVTDDRRKLLGVITTSIIATSYMSVFDNGILSEAKTPLINILDTLEGTRIVGDETQIMTQGKVIIAAANTDVMQDNMTEGDVVILGNRYEAQLGAIEAHARMLIICENAKVSRTIRKIAEDYGCTIIVTPYDAYTAARMIPLSLPVDFIMEKEPVCFDENAFIDDIKATMTKIRYRDFPVTKDGCYEGLISRRNLIDIEGKHIIMVDHNEESQAAVGMKQAEVVEIIDHHKLGVISTIKPINLRNRPFGCTATIVYQMYKHRNIPVPKHIAGLLCSAIVSDTLMFRSPTCTPIDELSCRELAEIAGLDLNAHARAMFDAGSDLGSKSVEDIFYMDFKKFKSGEVTFAVGQITSTSEEMIAELTRKMKPYLENARKKEGIDMVFFLLTDIFAENSVCICSGEHADSILEEGFKKRVTDGETLLEGVVSRKKQFVPIIMEQLSE